MKKNSDHLRPSKQIAELLIKALTRAGSMSALARGIGANFHVVRLWYRAGAQPSLKNLLKLENYTARKTPTITVCSTGGHLPTSAASPEIEATSTCYVSPKPGVFTVNRRGKRTNYPLSAKIPS